LIYNFQLDPGDRVADSAGSALAVVGVGNRDPSFGHPVALANAVAGELGESGEGVGRQWSRPGGEQTHAPTDVAAEVGVIEQAAIVGRNSHEHRCFVQRAYDFAGVKAGQKRYRDCREHGAMQRDEEAVHMKDGKAVNKVILVAESPGRRQRVGVVMQARVRQRGTLGSPGGARRVEQGGEIIVGPFDRPIERRGVDCQIGEPPLAVGIQSVAQHRYGWFRVTNEIVDFGRGERWVEGDVHGASPQARDVESDGLARFWYLHQHAVAGFGSECGQHAGVSTHAFVELSVSGDSLLRRYEKRRVES